MNRANESASAGRITFDGTELIVQFAYNKRRFGEIKRLRDARYDRQQKYWRVPVTALDRLEQLKSFNATLIHYDFDRAIVEKHALDLKRHSQQSVRRICENPFFVSENDIRAAKVDVTFRLHESPRGLRAEVRRYSRAKSLLEAIPEVHYLKQERRYFFPVDRLHSCITLLRDKHILFAVAEEAGLQLKATAAMRRLALEQSVAVEWKDLRGAMLVPYVRCVQNPDGKQDFSLCEYTTDQLRSLFPATRSYPERKLLARGFSEEQLLGMLNAARNTQTKVWLDGDVVQYLDSCKSKYRRCIEQSDSFDDALLAVTLPDICWCVDADGAALLVVRPETLVLLSGTTTDRLLDSAAQVTLHWAPRHRAFRFSDRYLTTAFTVVQSAVEAHSLHVPVSRQFTHLLSDARRRAELLRQQKHFHALVDTVLPELDEAVASRLFPHQRVAVRWLSSVTAGLFGDDMGLGKTLSILTGFHLRKSAGEVDKILVVCPQSLVSNWQREFEQWFPDYRVQALSKSKGRQEKEIACFRTDAEQVALIVNFETFRLDRIYPAIIEAASEQRLFLVIDESQRVKNASSKSFQALAATAHHAAYRFLLSGTPTPKDISDIWSQMFLIDLGQRFGQNYFDWLQSVAELGNTWSDYAVTRFLPEAVQETISRTHEVLLRRTKEKVVDLPEKLFVVRDVPLRGDQKKRYSEVCDQLLLRVTDLKGDEGFREIQSVLEEYLRAVQIASNPRLIDETWTGEPAKFQELDAILEEVIGNQGGKVVVWTNYLRNVAELKERCSAYGVVTLTGEVPAAQRSENIASFQSESEESPNVFVAIPAAGGVGITLTAAQTVVYLEKSWNAEQYLQSIDRVHRIGQTGTVTVINLHGCPIDTLIARNLRKKELNQRAVVGDAPAELSDILPSKEELLNALTV